MNDTQYKSLILLEECVANHKKMIQHVMSLELEQNEKLVRYMNLTKAHIDIAKAISSETIKEQNKERSQDELRNTMFNNLKDVVGLKEATTVLFTLMASLIEEL